MQKIKRMLEDLGDEQGWVLNEGEGEEVIVGLATTEGRSQSVHVDLRERDGLELLRIWSEVAEATHFGEPWQIVDFNWNHVPGALARRGRQVVLVHAQPARTVEPDQLAQLVAHIGRTADAIEHELYGDLDLS